MCSADGGFQERSQGSYAAGNDACGSFDSTPRGDIDDAAKEVRNIKETLDITESYDGADCATTKC